MNYLNKVATISATTIALILTGCTHGSQQLADQSQSSLEKNIIRGKTTKSQIKTLLGEPQVTSTENGKEQWIYHTTKTDAKTFIPLIGGFLMSGNGKAIEINFNRNGIVSDYLITTSKI